MLIKPDCDGCRAIRRKNGEEPDCGVCLPELWPENKEIVEIYLLSLPYIVRDKDGEFVRMETLSVMKIIDFKKIKNSNEVFDDVLALGRELL